MSPYPTPQPCLCVLDKAGPTASWTGRIHWLLSRGSGRTVSSPQHGIEWLHLAFCSIRTAETNQERATLWEVLLTSGSLKIQSADTTLTCCVPEITALSTFSSSSLSSFFTPSDQTAHQWWTQQPPVYYRAWHQWYILTSCISCTHN